MSRILDSQCVVSLFSISGYSFFVFERLNSVLLLTNIRLAGILSLEVEIFDERSGWQIRIYTAFFAVAHFRNVRG